MLAYLKAKYEYVLSYFRNSETIFLARAESAIGILTAGFASVDYFQVLATEGDWKTKAIVGGGMFAHGVLIEIGRRFREGDAPKQEDDGDVGVL